MSTALTKTNGTAVMVVKASSQIVKALDSPQVTVADPVEIFNALNMAVAKAYIDTGNKAPEGKISIGNGENDFIDLYSTMLNDLVLYIRMKLGTLRVNEIPVAIANGCMGEAGEFYGLNKKTFVQFLTVYCQSEARKKQLAEHIAANGEPKEVPSFEEQFNTAKGNVLEAYAGHLKEQKVDRLGVVVYDFLHSLGLINYGEDQNTKVFEYARMRVVNDLKNQQAGTPDMLARQVIVKSIEDIKAGKIEDKVSKEMVLVFNKAKTITMGKYFDDTAEAKGNLEALIESRRTVFYKLLADRSAPVDKDTI